MLKFFCIILIQFIAPITYSQTPKEFENKIVSSRINDSVLQTIYNRLNQGMVVTNRTITYTIYEIDKIESKIAFIDSILKQDYWEDEIRVKFTYMKLFFIQTTPSSISMPRKRSDSIYIATSSKHLPAFQSVYEKELLRYANWNATLGYNYKGVNNETADSAYCRVLQVQAYGVSENILNQIEKLQEQAIIGRLECARGNARKLKNIPIPYPFEMIAFPFYKQYMEELGEKVEFRSSLPKFFKKD